MAYPDYEKPFIVHTDAWNDGLGAVLYQRQDEKTRAVSDQFLYYTPEFTVYTDNNALAYILTSAKLNATSLRRPWVGEKEDFRVPSEISSRQV